MERAKGFTWAMNKVGDWSEELKYEVGITLRKFEARGVNAVIGSSGYMFYYNDLVSEMTNMPVILSPVNLLPIV